MNNHIFCIPCVFLNPFTPRLIYGHIFCHSETSKSGQNLLVLLFKSKIYGQTFVRCTEPLKTYVSTLPPYPDTERLPHPTTLGV